MVDQSMSKEYIKFIHTDKKVIVLWGVIRVVTAKRLKIWSYAEYNDYQISIIKP